MEMQKMRAGRERRLSGLRERGGGGAGRCAIEKLGNGVGGQNGDLDGGDD